MRYDSGAHNENLSSSASSFQLSPPLNACLTPVCRPRSVAQRFRVMIGRAHSEFFPGAITFRLVRTDSFFSLDYNTRQQIPRRRSPTDDQIYPLDETNPRKKASKVRSEECCSLDSCHSRFADPFAYTRRNARVERWRSWIHQVYAMYSF